MDAVKFQSFLDAVEPDRGGTVLSAEPIPSGYSRETVMAAVRWADGMTERFVLRGLRSRRPCRRWHSVLPRHQPGSPEWKGIPRIWQRADPSATRRRA